MKFTNWLMNEQIIQESVNFFVILEALESSTDTNELMAALQNAKNDPSKIGEFLELIQPLVEHLVLLQLRNPKHLFFDDVVQNTLMHIWDAISNNKIPENIENLNSWISKIMTNALIDIKRSKGYNPKISGKTPLEFDPSMETGYKSTSTEPSGLEYAFGQEEAESIRKAMRQLKPRLQTVLILYYAEGLSISKMADRLKVSIGTVKTRFVAAKKALRKALKDSPVKRDMDKEY